MLTKMSNSKLLSIQRVNPKLPVVKFSKCAITFLVVVLLVAVSASAYTVTQDGLNSVYEWELPSLSSVQALIVPKGQSGIAPSFTPSMRIQARRNGSVFYNAASSDFSNTSKRIGSISNTGNLGNSIFIFSTGTPNIFADGDFYESNIAVITLKSDVQTLTMKDSFYTFSVDFSTIFDFFSTTSLGSTYEERLEIFTSACKVYLLNDNTVVASLSPSNMSFQNAGITVQNSDGFLEEKGDIRYYERCSVEFLIRNEVDSLEIDSIQFSFPCMVGTSLSGNVDSPPYAFWFQSVGFSNPTMEVITTSQYDAMLVANYQNENLIKELSTINTIDQTTINAQKDKISQVGASTGKLSATTQLENSLSGQFDVSQEVDVLGNSDLLNTVSDFWDLIPWNSPFISTALGMVGSVALLSLILHAGERGLSLSFSHTTNKNNNKNSNNNSNKNSNSNKKGSG